MKPTRGIKETPHFTPGQIRRALDSERWPTTRMMDDETFATCQRYILEARSLAQTAAHAPRLSFHQRALFFAQADQRVNMVKSIMKQQKL